MAGLADFLNDDTKLETASRFLLNFGQGLTQANSQGLSPFASLAHGFGAGGVGLQQLKKERQAKQTQALQRKVLESQVGQLEAGQELSQFLTGAAPAGADLGNVNLPQDQISALQPADLNDPAQRAKAAGLFAKAGDLGKAADLALPNPYIKVGNQLLDRKTLQPVADTRLLPNNVFQQQMELKRAGATKIDVDTAGNSLAKNLGKGRAEQIVEWHGKAEEAQQSLASNREAKKLLDAGIISGFGANFKLGLGKALQEVGVNFADDAIANTEAYFASRVKETGRIITLFGAGTGLSDADREYAAKAAAGDIKLSEASMRRIMEINERASRLVVDRYNNIQNTVPPEILTSSGMPLTLEMPEPIDFGATAETPSAPGTSAADEALINKYLNE